MSDNLKWDAKRHDKAVTALNEETARQRVMPQIVKTYEAWKRRFKKKPKTQPEVIQELYRLQGMVGDITKHTPGMANFREFTMNLLDDKISDVVNTACGTRNIFTERAVPTSDNSLSIPEFHPFDTAEDLNGIPFLKKHIDREGFVGFIRSGRIIHALYSNDEIVLCGHVLTMVGINTLPTLEQVRKEIAKRPVDEGHKEGAD